MNPSRHIKETSGRRGPGSHVRRRRLAAAAVISAALVAVGGAVGLPTRAAAVSGVTVAPANTAAGAITTYTVSFTADKGLTGNSDIITLTAPAGTVFTSSNPTDYTVVVSGGVSGNPGTVSGSGSSTIALTTSIPASTGATVTVTANSVQNPPTPGLKSLSVVTSVSGDTSSSGSYTITSSLSVTAGAGQSARIGTPFASPFAVQVAGAGSGVPVTFTVVPGSTGASGTFAGGHASEVDSTDASGVATSSALTANGSAGPYSVSVSAPGTTSITIGVVNTTVPEAPASVSASGTDQSARVHWSLVPGCDPTSASACDGYSPITGYAITVLTGGSTVKTVTSPAGTLDATVTGLNNDQAYTFTVAAQNANGTGPAAGPSSPIRPDVTGYWLVASDGGIFSYGNPFYGSAGGLSLNAPIVGMADTPDGGGYWLVASDGGMFAYGDAGFYGSMGGKPLNRPIVAMTSTPDGHGYWLVASDGGIFAFGDAGFHGSMGGKPLNRPIVGIARTPTGAGYWLVASDGGIFSFGSARFFGSTGAITLNQPIVGMASPDSGGYWLVASDGGIFAFGDAGFFGSTGGIPLNKPIVGMVPSRVSGYWLVASDGGIFAFGGAPFLGSAGGLALNRPIVGMSN